MSCVLCKHKISGIVSGKFLKWDQTQTPSLSHCKNIINIHWEVLEFVIVVQMLQTASKRHFTKVVQKVELCQNIWIIWEKKKKNQTNCSSRESNA